MQCNRTKKVNYNGYIESCREIPWSSLLYYFLSWCPDLIGTDQHAGYQDYWYPVEIISLCLLGQASVNELIVWYVNDWSTIMINEHDQIALVIRIFLHCNAERYGLRFFILHCLRINFITKLICCQTRLPPRGI